MINNREIIFRGKSRKNDAWLYGDLVHRIGTFVFPEDGIDSVDNYEIDHTTLGQYTGLIDENGKKVFEGDIVRVTDCDAISRMDTGDGVVVFFDGLWYVDGGPNNALYDLDKYRCIEVIGNTHDNPEFAEVIV